MQHSRVWGFTALVALYAFAQPALAFTTTYYWALEGASREDATYVGCQGDSDPAFPLTFPELCGGTIPAQQLSVTSSTTSGSGWML